MPTKRKRHDATLMEPQRCINFQFRKTARSLSQFYDEALRPESSQQDSPPLRNRVTFQATLLTSLRRILPDGIFETIMRLVFKLNHD